MMATSAGPLCALREDIWLVEAPVRILGMQLTSTMTVVRLGDGRLLVHSPVAFGERLRSEVASLGEVAHLYAPSLYHHLHVGTWAAAFPAARVHAPGGLAGKRRDLHIDRDITAGPDAELAAVLDEIRIDGFRLDETVLFHRPSRTLIVADLVHNVGRPRQPWAQLYTRVMGFYDRVALSRAIRAAGFRDRRAARRSIDAVLSLPIERIVVGHGAPILDDARQALAAAYAWLGTGPIIDRQ